MPGLSRPRVPNRNREIIGEFLAEKRRELDLTQEQFQQLVGREAWSSAWSAVETGQRNLPPYLWERVAKALRVRNDEFGKFMLRHTNPWVYGMIYGFTQALREELETIPDRYVSQADITTRCLSSSRAGAAVRKTPAPTLTSTRDGGPNRMAAKGLHASDAEDNYTVARPETRTPSPAKRRLLNLLRR